MDRLTSMGVFVRAADLGSFAAAARDLGMSPQMVAKHVAHLEDRLGTSLIARTTRRQSLTEIGRGFYERCKVVLADAAEAEEIALEMKRRPAGTLRVNAPVTFGAHSLSPVIARYLDAYPEIQLELTLSDGYVDPLEDGFEVILRIGALADSSMIAVPLRPYRLIPCASPDYVARHGAPATPAELTEHAWLVYGAWSATMPCRWVFTRDGVTEEVRSAGRLRANDWKVLLAAAIAGHGVTLGPEEVLREEITAGRLVQLLPGYEGPARQMHALVPPGRRPTAKTRSFLNALTEAFGPRAGSAP